MIYFKSDNDNYYMRRQVDVLHVNVGGLVERVKVNGFHVDYSTEVSKAEFERVLKHVMKVLDLPGINVTTSNEKVVTQRKAPVGLLEPKFNQKHAEALIESFAKERKMFSPEVLVSNEQGPAMNDPVMVDERIMVVTGWRYTTIHFKFSCQPEDMERSLKANFPFIKMLVVNRDGGLFVIAFKKNKAADKVVRWLQEQDENSSFWTMKNAPVHTEGC